MFAVLVAKLIILAATMSSTVLLMTWLVGNWTSSTNSCGKIYALVDICMMTFLYLELSPPPYN